MALPESQRAEYELAMQLVNRLIAQALDEIQTEQWLGELFKQNILIAGSLDVDQTA